MSGRVAPDSRLEVKFVTGAHHLGTIVNWFQMHPACFREHFAARWVNNVYFDTFDYHAYRQNLLGGSSRQKIRYRWYGTNRLPSSGALEIKCKRNYFGWKLRFPIEGEHCEPGER